MQKILIITSLYPNKENSIRGIFIKKQVQEISNRNEVKVFVTEISKTDSYEVYAEDDIEVHRIQYTFPKFIISPIYYYFSVKKKLKKLIHNYNPDVIHIHDYKHIPEIFTLSFLLGNENIKKSVITFHNSRQQFDSHLSVRWFYLKTLRHVLNKFSKIIVVSKKVKDLILPYCNDPNRINVIGNGVNGDFLKIMKVDLMQYLPKSNNAYKIISVGNLVNSKGFNLIIEAVTKLNNEGHDVELNIIGEGIERNNLENLIINNGMKKRIRLLGRVHHDIVMNLYTHYNAFVLPSWSETFGIVYLEAMLNKIPVIGVKGEGIDGIIIDGENGFLVERNSVIDLEKTILKMMCSDNIKQITKNGFNNVNQEHLLENVIEQIEKVYEK